jgi:hypothetical protein
MVIAAGAVYYFSTNIAAQAAGIARDKALSNQKTGVLSVLAE